MPLFRMLVSAGIQYAVADLMLRGTTMQQRSKYLLRGLVLWVLAAFVLSLAAVFLLLTLFFVLADMTTFIRPAVITGLLALAVAALLVSEGRRQMRQR